MTLGAVNSAVSFCSQGSKTQHYHPHAGGWRQLPARSFHSSPLTTAVAAPAHMPSYCCASLCHVCLASVAVCSGGVGVTQRQPPAWACATGMQHCLPIVSPALHAPPPLQICLCNRQMQATPGMAIGRWIPRIMWHGRSGSCSPYSAACAAARCKPVLLAIALVRALLVGMFMFTFPSSNEQCTLGAARL